MSFMGSDPGDLTQDEMYGREPLEGTLVWRAPCPVCRNQDGSLNTEVMDEEGSCLFGCGRTIGDTGMCSHCGDHSCNHYECERCGNEYDDWTGWKKVDDGEKADADTRANNPS